MICPFCAKEIPEDSKFCVKCGGKIPRCPTCGQQITEKTTRFCTQDGTPIPEEVLALIPEEVPETPPEPERRVFCIQCGKPCSPEELLCDSCRRAQQPTETPQTTASRQSAPRKEKSAVPIVIAVCAVLVLLLGGFSYFWVSGGLSSLTARGSADSAQDKDGGSLTDRASADEKDDEKREPEPETTASQRPQTSAPKATPSPSADGADQQEPQDQEEDPVLYFILNADRMYFDRSDLKDFDADMCRLARNGIYARMGRRFNDESLSAYFSQFAWYHPTIDPGDFKESMLNDYQVANRDLIVAYEQEKGFR